MISAGARFEFVRKAQSREDAKERHGFVMAGRKMTGKSVTGKCSCHPSSCQPFAPIRPRFPDRFFPGKEHADPPLGSVTAPIRRGRGVGRRVDDEDTGCRAEQEHPGSPASDHIHHRCLGEVGKRNPKARDEGRGCWEVGHCTSPRQTDDVRPSGERTCRPADAQRDTRHLPVEIGVQGPFCGSTRTCNRAVAVSPRPLVRCTATR